MMIKSRFMLVVMMQAIAGLCASAIVSEAQTPVTGSISGYVTDENRKPLPGVTVTVRDVNKTVETTVVTDAVGYYVFPILEPSTYTVRATLASFHDVVYERITVNVGARARLDFTLTPQTKIAEAVTVRAEAMPKPAPMTTSVAWWRFQAMRARAM